MTRLHVRLMFAQRGYTVAKKVLIERKARREFFVYLEMIERDRRIATHRRAVERNDVWVRDGNAVHFVRAP
jgi:hypothetical protein